MDLEEEILREHSKRQVLRIAAWIGNDPEKFRQLCKLFLKGDAVLSQRAAWIIGYLGEHKPVLLRPWLRRLVKKMMEPGVHDAVKRNVVKALLSAEIPRPLLGTVVTFCFDELSSPAGPIAVRAYSMMLLASFAEREPDLRRELRITVEQLMPNGGPGLRACGKNVLKRLSVLFSREG
jgi:hypothetical protein